MSMFVVREATHDDLPELLDMARGVNFINLPPHEDVLRRKIDTAQRCFAQARSGAAPPPGDRRWERAYLFVLRDERGKCVGTSSINAGMGSSENPNLSYQIVKTIRRSLALSGAGDHPSGEVQNYVLRMFRDRSSPTELGGLLLRPELRGSGYGRLMGWTRFQYIAAHRPWFADRMLAEMMAIIDRYNDGNAFWRALPRKFINMSYQQADRLSTKDREFMYSLLPDHINLTLLPCNAIDIIGQVGEATRPARRMLEELGFRYTHRIDPFDGGPHLEADLDRVSAINRSFSAAVARSAGDATASMAEGIISVERPDTGFMAVAGHYAHEPGATTVDLSEPAYRTLGLSPGETVWITPYDIPPARIESEPLPVVRIPDVTKTDSYDVAELFEPYDGRGPWPEDLNNDNNQTAAN
jgi:arginine N-succinyltransferase